LESFMSRRVVAVLVAIAVVVAVLMLRRGGPSDESVRARFQGYLAANGKFTQCGAESQQKIRVPAPAQDVCDALMRDGNRGSVYMDFLGRAGSEGKPKELTVLLHAATESHGCEEDLTGFEFHAYGNEPFWNVEIMEDEIVFASMSTPEKIVFPREITTQWQGGTSFVSQRDGNGPSQIEIIIERGDCRDTMSGAYFGFEATVKVGDQELTGCARRGR